MGFLLTYSPPLLKVFFVHPSGQAEADFELEYSVLERKCMTARIKSQPDFQLQYNWSLSLQLGKGASQWYKWLPFVYLW